jgi:hypothetical protein
MYRVLVGDFDFTEIYQNNRVIGPVFLLMWTMIGLTVLFNVFVAILMESYEITKTEEVGFVDMIQKDIMKPFAQQIGNFMKRLGMQVVGEDDASRKEGEVGDGQQLEEGNKVTYASFGRLKRPKKVLKESEVCENFNIARFVVQDRIAKSIARLHDAPQLSVPTGSSDRRVRSSGHAESAIDRPSPANTRSRPKGV